jgi:hypothetical protein
MKTKVEKEWITRSGLKARIIYMDWSYLNGSNGALRPRRCGYVRLPDNSQFKGMDYDEYAYVIVMGSDDPVDEGITVHGGLTFAGERDQDDGWWFGFDCAHAGDTSEVWTLGRVIVECEDLALQMSIRDTIII